MPTRMRAGMVRATLRISRALICWSLRPSVSRIMPSSGAMLNQTKKLRKKANQVRCSMRMRPDNENRLKRPSLIETTPPVPAVGPDRPEPFPVDPCRRAMAVPGAAKGSRPCVQAIEHLPEFPCRAGVGQPGLRPAGGHPGAGAAPDCSTKGSVRTVAVRAAGAGAGPLRRWTGNCSQRQLVTWMVPVGTLSALGGLRLFSSSEAP